MKRLLLVLVGFLLASGCGLFGSDDSDRCDGREGLFIQTDRESYRAGEEATVTVENCTDETLFIERAHTEPPDYNLEKRIGDEWVLASSGEILDFRLVKVESGDLYEFVLPVEPFEDFVDVVSGIYRYEIDLHDGRQTEDELPKEKRVSNTFEIVE